VNDAEDKSTVIDKHFSRARVVISAVAVAVTIGLSIANVVDDFQRDLANLHVEHERDVGEIRSVDRGVEETLRERNERISNLEQQVYEIKNNPNARKDPFTGAEGRELKQRLEQLEKLELLEHQTPITEITGGK
jgi:hypothetical protein